MSISVSASMPVGYGLNEPEADNATRQSVGDAAYRMAYRYPGGVDALAVRMGVNVNTLAHKLNPNNSTHHLSLAEALTMQVMANDASILHAMAAALGYTCVRATPDQAGGDPLEATTHMQVQMAELLRAVCDAVREGQGAVSRNQFKRVGHHADEAIAAIGHTVAMVRGRMRPAPEAL